jgi:hypothetical protein
LRGPRLAQLLQHAPPDRLTAEHELLAGCGIVLRQLAKQAKGLPASAKSGQQLRGMLRHDAAQSAAVLAVWVLQRPELLHVAQQAPDDVNVFLAGFWVYDQSILKVMAAAVGSIKGSRAAVLGVELTEQLKRSGGHACAGWRCRMQLH